MEKENQQELNTQLDINKKLKLNHLPLKTELRRHFL